MPEIEIDDMQAGYMQWVDFVRTHGRPRAPRGQVTRDVRDLTVVLRHPERSLTEYIGRKASTKLAALEAAQLVAGTSVADLMGKVAPTTRQFMSPNGTFHGAYGPRIQSAIPLLIRRLLQDSDTRQAVASIFDSNRDLETGIKDVPCTMMLCYDIDDGALDAQTFMRSNDVSWGVAHDVFMFTILQRTLAAFLGLEVGEYRHTARSAHVYERDFEMLDRMHAPTKPATVAPALWQPEWGITTDPDEAVIDWITGPDSRARRILDGDPYPEETPWWTDMSHKWRT